MKICRSGYATFIAAGALVVLMSSACSKSPAPPQEEKKAAAKPAPSMPNVKVTPAVQKKVDTPKPGPKATKQHAADQFGKGKTSITVKGHPGGATHSFWAEELDVDGSGNPVQVDEAWDNRHKVLYISKDRTFTCGNGQSADGSTMMAVYGKGNTLQKPAGSGWWVAELDRGECAVEEAGVYGCRFDAAGNNTDCGSATIHSDEDDVVIIPLPGAAAPQTPAQPQTQTPAPPSDAKQ
ncbi:MAG TPA: hypothetical protein VGS58_09090 [Candidatus Sulfopaludibacter sp.]|nr:hypothetical protein [Candidatus Sulfopaludibacter sp.]